MANMIVPTNPPKNPMVATILSCILPGIGQLYLGQVTKGIVMLVASIVLSVVTVGIGGLAVWVVAMIDANKIGNKLLQGKAVEEWEFF